MIVRALHLFTLSLSPSLPLLLAPSPCPVQREYGQDRLSWEREEKLVVSAWYEMVSCSYTLLYTQ